MSHLYLHQKDDYQIHEDLEGADYPSLKAAVEDAIMSARQLMADRVMRGLQPDGWRFEITDELGQVLAIVPFRETLTGDGQIDPKVSERWYRAAPQRPHTAGDGYSQESKLTS